MIDDNELKNLWKSATHKTQAALVSPSLDAIQRRRIKSGLRPLQRTKIAGIAFGAIWLILVAYLIHQAWLAELHFFVVSAGIHFIISSAAIGVYVYHLILVRRVDLSGHVVEVQEKLSRLQSSTIEIARWLFLQLPVFTTFQINESMLEGHPVLWVLQIGVTIGFTWLGVWFFRNIHIRNANKRWFRFIFRGAEWDPAIEAKRFVDELNQFKEASADIPEETTGTKPVD